MTFPFLVAAVLLFASLERYSRFQFRRSKFLRAHFVTDAAYLLTGYVAAGLLFTNYFGFAAHWTQMVWPFPDLSSIDLPSWSLVLPALILLDLGNYVCHYCLHRFDFLWEFHKIHHSSPTLDWLATFRSHLVEQALRRLLGPLLLILFGFPVTAVLSAGGILLAWAVLNHSNLSLNFAFIEKILITPRLHRVHHLPRQSESNLGTVFTFWDSMRGTLTLVQTNEKSYFGIADRQYPQNWLAQFIKPFRTIWNDWQARNQKRLSIHRPNSEVHSSQHPACDYGFGNFNPRSSQPE